MGPGFHPLPSGTFPDDWPQTLVTIVGMREDRPDGSIFVTPAKAGVQCLSANGARKPSHWIPAFAGMTRR